MRAGPLRRERGPRNPGIKSMSWRYSQSTGHLLDPNGSLLSVGYSGRGEGLNAPEYQNVPDVGPLPQGAWEIGEPYDSPDHGPYVLPLTPLEGTETFGRTAFKCHGDEKEHPGEHLASLGCMIQARFARIALWERNDHILEVVP